MKNSFFKKINLLYMIPMLLLFFIACAQKQTSTVGDVSKIADIRIKVNGLNGGSAQLAGVYGDQHYLLDTLKIESDGQIHIKRDSVYKSGLYYVILPDDSNIQLLLDVDQEFNVETVLGDIANATRITGSIDNDLLYQSIKLADAQEKEQLKLQQAAQGKPDTDPAMIAYTKLAEENRKARKNQIDQFKKNYPNALVTKFKLAGQNPEIREPKNAQGQLDKAAQAIAFRNEYWDMVDLKDPRFLSTPLIGNKIKIYFNDLTTQHQDSIIKQIDMLLPKTIENHELFKYISNWLLFKFEPGKTTLMDGEAVFSHVVSKYFTHQNVDWLTPGSIASLQIRAKEMAGSLLNHKALDVIAKNTAGETKSIFEIKSPYIIVYLYHTDCEHCQEETPILAKMYPQLKSRGVEFYTIAVNTSDAEWKKFVIKYNMSQWINVFDPTNAAIYGKYYVDNTPEIYVLNKDRVIIGKNLKPEQINTILDLDEKK